LLIVREYLFQVVWLKFGIGRQKNDHVSSRSFHSQVASHAASLAQTVDQDYTAVGIFLDDLFGAIVRVIDEDDLLVGICLRKRGFEGEVYIFLLVLARCE
jgi:hypothetical protein